MKTLKISLILFAFFASLLPIELHAQRTAFEAGIEGGPSLVSLRGNPVSPFMNGTAAGFVAGLSFQYNLNRFISLRTNVSFERKGSSFASQFTDDQGNSLGAGTIRFNYDYLTVPLLVRAGYGEKVRGYINAGPYFGYLIARETVMKWGLPESRQNDMKYSRREDYGIAFGLGFSIPIGEKFLVSAEARNSLGLFNTSSVPIRGDGYTKTNSLSMLLGASYCFN